MFFISTFRKWLQRKSRPIVSSKTLKKRSFRLRLEALENRLVPAGLFMDNTWHFVTDTDNSGTLTAGDIVNNANNLNSPGTISAAYAVEAFGVVPDAPGAAKSLAGFATLQDAVNNTPAAGTLNILDGTYNIAASVQLNNNITIAGPNVGINADSGTSLNPARLAEAIIHGDITDIPSASAMFQIGAGATTYTIDGLDFTGTAQPINSYNSNKAAETVQNNIFSGTDVMFFELGGATGTLTFANNRLENMVNTDFGASGDRVPAVQVGVDTGATPTEPVSFTGNVVTSSAVVSGFNLSSVSGTVSGNTFSSLGRFGLLVANASGGVAGLTVANNTFDSINTDPAAAPPSAGLVFRLPQQLTGTVNVTGNTFTNNTHGILLRGSGATTPDATGNLIHINGNSLQNNVADNVLYPNGASVLDMSANWWGTNTPGGVTATIAGAGGNVDYTPFLDSGTDTSPAVGFQGDFTKLHVDANSPQTGLSGPITEAIALLPIAGGTVFVHAGNYNESVDATSKAVNLEPGGASSPAAATITGALTLNSGDTLSLKINGNNAATPDFDQLTVTGLATLGNATLTLSGTYTPVGGDTFNVVHFGSISGTFNGLPDGSTLFFNGQPLKIHYDTINNVVVLSYNPNPVINGTNGIDDIRVLRVGSNVRVTVNGATVLDAPVASLTTLTINGLNGADTLKVDFTSGSPIPSGGLFFDGGGNAGDQLVVTGYNVGTVTSVYTGAHSGTVQVGLGAPLINYQGLAPLTLSGTATDLVIDLSQTGVQNPDAVLSDDGTAGDPDAMNDAGFSAIHGSTFEYTELANPSTSLTVIGGNLTDTIQLAAMDAAFAPTSEVFSGPASDTFRFTNAGAVPGTTALTVTTATLDLNGFSPTIGGLNGSGTVTNSAAAGTAVLTDNGGGSFTGNITDGATAKVALTVAGASQTLTLSGNNTYSGLTTINATDTLKAGSGTALTANTNVTDNGILDLNGNSITIGALNGTGAVIDSGAAATLTVTAGGAFSGNITGANTALTVAGASQTLTLSGSNTYSGLTTINATDTLKVGAANATSANSSVADNGILDLGGFSTAIGALTGTGTVTSSVAGAATLTVGANGGTGSFAGIIQNGSGTVALAKSGAGTETLTNNTNSYSGGTTINAGTLAIDTDAELGVGGGVTLNAANASTATLEVTATTASARGFTLSGAGANTVQVDAASVYTISGQIVGSGTGGLVKTGTGTLTLSNITNSYSGGTTITAGTLSIGDDRELGDASGRLTFNGGILNATGDVTSVRPVTVNAAVGTNTINTNSHIVTMTNVASGIGNGDLTVNGPGTFNPTGSISGSLTVNGAHFGPGIAATESGTGTFSVGGNLTLANLGANNPALDVDLTSSAPLAFNTVTQTYAPAGTVLSNQAIVTGAIALGATTSLNVLLISNPINTNVNDRYVVISGTTAAGGPFTNPLNGSGNLVLNNQQYSIAYGAGVVLTHVNTDPTAAAATVNTASIFESQTASVTSGSFADPDPFDVHTVTINWGDSGAGFDPASTPSTFTLGPGVLTFDVNRLDINGASIAPLLTHKYRTDSFQPNGTPGTFQITVTVTDNHPGSVTAQAPPVPPITVHPASVFMGDKGKTNLPVVTPNGSGQLLTQSGLVLAEFLAVGLPKTTASYSATVNWGESSPTESSFPVQISGPNANDVFTVTYQGQHQFATFGTFTVTVTVTKENGPTTRMTFPIFVAANTSDLVAQGIAARVGGAVGDNGAGRKSPPAVLNKTEAHEGDADLAAYLAGLASNSLNSTSSIINQVRALYRLLFHRDPVNADGTFDPGINIWTHFLAQGGQVDQLEALLMSAPEYTAWKQVDALYSTLFGRTPITVDPNKDSTGTQKLIVNDPGAAAAVNFLVNGGQVAQLEAGLMGSAEYFAKVPSPLLPGSDANDRFLQNVYLDGLGRPASSLAEIAGWKALLVGGTPRSQVAFAILQSPEGLAFAINGPNDPNNIFLTRVYQDGLGRNPGSIAELAGWKQLLLAGVPRSQVALFILDSTEGRTFAIDNLYLKDLARHADAGGLNANLAFLNSGGTLRQVEINLLSSLELFDSLEFDADEPPQGIFVVAAPGQVVITRDPPVLAPLDNTSVIGAY